MVCIKLAATIPADQHMTTPSTAPNLPTRDVSANDCERALMQLPGRNANKLWFMA